MAGYVQGSQSSQPGAREVASPAVPSRAGTEEVPADGLDGVVVIEEESDSGDFGSETTQRVVTAVNIITTDRTTVRDMQAVGREEAPGLASVRVLVVDRDQELQAALRAIGRQQLFEVVAAFEAADAVAQARAVRFDAAIIDVDPQWPEVSFQLAASLRALAGRATLPLAFMSSDGQLPGRVAAAQAGAALFLVKPLDPDAFIGAVHQLAAVQRAEQARILVVDDDEWFCSEVAAVLQTEGMAVWAIHEPGGILNELDRARPDVLLLDNDLPGVSGLEICRMLRAVPRWQDLPILFLTGRYELETRVAAFAAGCDDYLIKPMVSEELLARIHVRIERARLLRERVDKDMLTGLWLRRPFMEALAARLAEALRHQRPLTLCLLDLDRFKLINDTRGHLAGDRVLASFGQLLQGRFRKEDLRARWGGEEFVLAFPGESVSVVHGLLSKVLVEFGSIGFLGDDSSSFQASFSAGIAAFPEDGGSAHALLTAADRRLRRAKLAGRSTILCVG